MAVGHHPQRRAQARADPAHWRLSQDAGVPDRRRHLLRHRNHHRRDRGGTSCADAVSRAAGAARCAGRGAGGRRDFQPGGRLGDGGLHGPDGRGLHRGPPQTVRHEPRADGAGRPASDRAISRLARPARRCTGRRTRVSGRRRAGLCRLRGRHERLVPGQFSADRATARPDSAMSPPGSAGSTRSATANRPT